MGWKKINDEHLTSYADSIRYAKNGTVMPEIERYTPTQMETELQAIAEGYVSAVDELAQDNTYFSEISTAIVDKDGGSPPEKADMAGRIEALDVVKPPVEEKDVNFYDYDGTLLYSYTPSEALALNELPEQPSHDGLIFQEWNWTIEDLKQQVSTGHRAMIGATYITDDGTTKLYLLLQKGFSIPILQINVYMNGNQTATVDWGNGDIGSLINSGVFEKKVIAQTNIQAPNEDTVLCIKIIGGKFSLGSNVWGETIFNGSSSNDVSKTLIKVETGNNCTGFMNYTFANCYCLEDVCLSNNINSVGNYAAFAKCYFLKTLIFPKNIKLENIFNSEFQNTTSLKYLIFPFTNNITGTLQFAAPLQELVLPPLKGNEEKLQYSFSSYVLKNIDLPDFSIATLGIHSICFCVCLKKLKIPSSIKKIEASALVNLESLLVLDLTAFDSQSTIPVLDNINAFDNLNSSCEFWVTQDKYNEFMNATNWATFADRYVIKEV